MECRQLLTELEDMVAPVMDGVEPGEGGRKRRVVPTAGEPGAVMQHAQGAQSFDQEQFTMVEVAELAVAIKDFGDLQGLPLAIT